jgi:NAD(P)-dependent dehydrogenase (short-subunit alcohol dehydrogenase family)
MASKIALITGASSGIGLLATIELAKAGYTVVATMRNLDRKPILEKAAREADVLERIDMRRLNITETATIAPVIAEVVRDHQRINVLVNNAGFAIGGFSEDVTLDELRTQFETNFFGHAAMTKAVIPVMRQQRSGHIIMISSIAGLVCTPGTGSYGASKFALEGWSEALRIELLGLGIKVVLVEPGSFATDIWERNVVVGKEALSETSPNKDRSRRFVEFIRGKTKKKDARVIAHLIVRIANNPNPRLRYMIGTDARLAYMLKRMLPWKSFEKLILNRMGIDKV